MSTVMARQRRSDTTRSAILDAALAEFAAHGFEAASTREIAARAGVHQPQINYHFDSKEALWQAAVDHLFALVDAELGERVDTSTTEPAAATATGTPPSPSPPLDPVAEFASAIRTFVRAAARYPELNRIMVQEATSPSDRLTWIVERHVRHRYELVTRAWERLRAEQLVPPLDPTIVFYSLVGAASLLYANAPEARLLTGRDDLVDDALVDAHADALVGMFLSTTRTDHRPGSSHA
jgi:TetR/AcrR family transcriptional regulator